MTLLADSGNGHDAPGLITGKGRPVIFTPERMDQIRNLVERGHSREEIAGIVGCTVNSLQVTCSKAGVSLRRPRDVAPIKIIKRAQPTIPEPPKPSDMTRDPKDVLEPPKSAPPVAKFTLRIEYGNRTMDVPLALDSASFGDLAFQAVLKDVPLSQIIADALVIGIRKITS